METTERRGKNKEKPSIMSGLVKKGWWTTFSLYTMLVRVKLEHQLLLWAQHNIYKPWISWGVKLPASQALLLKHISGSALETASLRRKFSMNVCQEISQILPSLQHIRTKLGNSWSSLAGPAAYREGQYFYHSIMCILYICTHWFSFS